MAWSFCGLWYAEFVSFVSDDEMWITSQRPFREKPFLLQFHKQVPLCIQYKNLFLLPIIGESKTSPDLSASHNLVIRNCLLNLMTWICDRVVT